MTASNKIYLTDVWSWVEWKHRKKSMERSISMRELRDWSEFLEWLDAITKLIKIVCVELGNSRLESIWSFSENFSFVFDSSSWANPIFLATKLLFFLARRQFPLSFNHLVPKWGYKRSTWWYYGRLSNLSAFEVLIEILTHFSLTPWRPFAQPDPSASGILLLFLE